MAILAGHKVRAADFPSAYLHVYQTAAQTLTNGTFAAITFTSEIVDTINGHSIASQTSRYTPLVAGYYRCHGQVMFVANTTGDRAAQFRKNATIVAGAPYGGMPAMNGAVFLAGIAQAHATIACNGSSDYIELYGAQNSGGNLDTAVNATSPQSWMICEWVAPL